MNSKCCIAGVLAASLMAPLCCSAESLAAAIEPARVDPVPAGLLRVNVRIEGLERLEGSNEIAGKCVAYVEGFGPVSNLDRWLERRSELTELNFVCVQLTDSDIDAILQLPRLTKLGLRGCQLSGTQLERLRASPSIREFDLHAVSLTSLSLADHR